LLYCNVEKTLDK